MSGMSRGGDRDQGSCSSSGGTVTVPERGRPARSCSDVTGSDGSPKRPVCGEPLRPGGPRSDSKRAGEPFARSTGALGTDAPYHLPP